MAKIRIGRFSVEKKGMKLVDWFLYAMMDKFGNEEFFSHWDDVERMKEEYLMAGEEERKEIVRKTKVSQAFSTLWWSSNVQRKELVTEDEFKEWAKGLYDAEVMPRFLWNKTSKKEYSNVVSEMASIYGPKFIGEDDGYEKLLNKRRRERKRKAADEERRKVSGDVQPESSEG